MTVPTFPTDMKAAESDRIEALTMAVQVAEKTLDDSSASRGEHRRALERWRAAHAELDRIRTVGYVWTPDEGYPAEGSYINNQ